MLKKFSKFYKSNYLKKLYYKFLDIFIIFIGLNKKNKILSNNNKVIWITEIGSRDFIPRLAQAISLWNEYSIASLVIHKHMIRKLDKRLFKNTVLIDKSATNNCIRRLRYAKLNGAFNIVIPEELLICDSSERQIKGTLNPKTLNYIDIIFSSSMEVNSYIESLNKNVKVISKLNPRLCISLIKKNCEKYFLSNNQFFTDLKKDFILINDKLALKFSSLENEIDLLENNIFKNTDIDASRFIDEYLKQEEKDELLLVKLIHEIRKEKKFDRLKIIIRPHPSVDIDKYKSYFEEILDQSLNYSIIRDGNVIDWMNKSKITFHNNCTTAIEGYFNGLENIFNYSEKLREGTSLEFKNIIKPFGIKNSILKAKHFIEIDSLKNLNFKKVNNLKSKDNIYFYLGNKMNNKKNSRVLKINLIEFFKNININEYSPKQRWLDAEAKIDYIKKNKLIFDKLNVYNLGKVGVQVGDF